MLPSYIVKSRKHISAFVTSRSRITTTLSNIYSSTNKMAPMSYSSALTGRKDSNLSMPNGQRDSSNAESPNIGHPQQASTNSNSSTHQQHANSNNQHPPNAPHQQTQQPKQAQPQRSSRKTQQQAHPNQPHQPNSGAYTRDQYVRRADQTPHTSNAHETHYIVSLTTSAHLHQTLTDLRTQHFPKHLNKLQSHVALFRALPGSKLPQIEKDIASLCARTPPFALKTAGAPFRLRQGVGVKLEGGKAEVTQVFQELKGAWQGEGWLSEQDKAFQPHYTVQNKVEEEGVVQKAMKDVQGKLGGGVEGKATGLSMFEYKKGYWNFQKSWRFEGEMGGNGGKSGSSGGDRGVPGSEAA
jgi:2'-5' RNA ligase